MRKRWILGTVGVLALFLAGCGDGGTITTVITGIPIPSDNNYDGDVNYDPISKTYQLTLVKDLNPSVDPLEVLTGVGQSGLVYRGFFDFPLDGFTQGEVIPPGAFIESAVMEVFISRFTNANRTAIWSGDGLRHSIIPVRLELVAFPQPLTQSVSGFYYNVVPNTPVSRTFLIWDFDLTGGEGVPIDVTVLLREAQRLFSEFPVSFQLRLRIDDDSDPTVTGLIGVDEATPFQPLLFVDYRI